MSLLLLNSAKAVTATGMPFGVNQAKATCAFLFRLNAPTPLTSVDYNLAFFLQRSGGKGLLVSAASINETAQTMSFTLAWRATNEVAPVYRPNILPNIVYAVVLTYDKDNPSDQAVYLNGVKYQLAPTQTLPLHANSTALEVGIFYTGSQQRNFSIANLNLNNNYVWTRSEVFDFMAGTSDSRTIGASSGGWRGCYTFAGPIGTNAAFGDAGVTNQVDGSWPFTPSFSPGVAGSSITYGDPMPYVSQASYRTPIVMSSGKSLLIETKAPDESAIKVTDFGPDMPTVTIDGGSPFACAQRLSTTHNGAIFAFPAGKKANPNSSVVRLTASDGFLATSIGTVPGCTDLLCDNKSGRPILEDEPRTMKIGFNDTYPASADWGGYQGPCNWALRLKINRSTETSSTIRDDGTLKVNRLNVPLVTTNAATSFDLLDYPMPLGKWFVEYVPTDVGRATSIVPTTNTPGAISELTAYRNNGSAPGSPVRAVYNLIATPEYANTLVGDIDASTTSITLANGTNILPASQFSPFKPYMWLRVDGEYMEIRTWNAATKVAGVIRGTLGSTAAPHAGGTACVTAYYSQNPQLRLNITGPGGVPSYTDLVVYHESDIALPSPARQLVDGDVDTTFAARIRPTKFLRDSAVNCGIMRTMDSSGGGFSQMCEPEDLRRDTDIYWGQDPKYNTDWRWDTIKAFDPVDTPYIYWRYPFTGSETYSATLVNPITTTGQTSITVAYTDTNGNQILVGSRLLIGSEWMRVTAITGPATGATATVVRAQRGTTAATHSAGSITVGWRLPITSTDQYQSPDYVACDVTTDVPHNMRSGMWNGDPADLDMNPAARFSITLAASCAAAATSLTIAPGDITKWPYITTGLYLKFGTDVVRIATADSTTGVVTLDAGIGSAHMAGEIGASMCTGVFTRSTDGTTTAWTPKSPTSIYFYVLGPNRLLVNRVVRLGGKVGIVEGVHHWDLTPKVVSGSDTSQVHWSFAISTYPYTWTAQRTALSPGAIHWLNIPATATDEYVRDVARQVYSNLPVGAGHEVVVEFCNELWNFLFPYLGLGPRQSALAGLGYANTYDWFVVRSRAVADVVEAVRAEMGHDAPARLCLASQTAAIDRTILRGEILGVYADVASTAPYYDVPYTTAIKDYYNAVDDDQCIDAWLFDYRYNASVGAGARVAIDAGKLDAYRARTGRPIKWYAYEGGFATMQPLPTSGISDTSIYPYGIARDADLSHNPTLYHSTQDRFITDQQRGIGAFCVFDLMQWPHQNGTGNNFYLEQWGLTHYHGQPAGKGDGSDGKADNRTNLARPGQPGTKPPLQNYALNNVSVRLGAIMKYNADRAGAEPPPEPEVRVPTDTFAHWYRGEVVLAAAAVDAPSGHFEYSYRGSLAQPVIFHASAFAAPTTGGGAGGGTSRPTSSYLMRPTGGGVGGGVAAVSLQVNPLALGSFGYWAKGELYLAAAQYSTGHFEHAYRGDLAQPVIIAGAAYFEEASGGGIGGGRVQRAYVAAPAVVGGGIGGGRVVVAARFAARTSGGGVGGGVGGGSVAVAAAMTAKASGGGRGGGAIVVAASSSRQASGGGRGGGQAAVVGSSSFVVVASGGGVGGGVAAVTSRYVRRSSGGGVGGGVARFGANRTAAATGGGVGGGSVAIGAPTSGAVSGGGVGGGVAKVSVRSLIIDPCAAVRAHGRGEVDPAAAVAAT